MRSSAGILLVSAALVAGGCGSNASADVRAKVEQFVTAVSKRDYTTICDQVLAPSLVARLTAAGVNCSQAMQVAFSAVENPTLSIAKIHVTGHTASAVTLTSAQGQPSSVDAIELTDTSHGWRVVSLGSPER